MSDLEILLEQKRHIEQQIKEIQARGTCEAIANARALIQDYQLSEADVFGRSKTRARLAQAKQSPRR